MNGFNHIASEMSRRKSHYTELAVRKAPVLRLDARYVRKGYATASSPATTLMLLSLMSACDFKTRQCKRSVGWLMKRVGVKNRNTAFKAIRRLQELRIINIGSAHGESHVYTLNDQSMWITISGDTTSDTGTNIAIDTPDVSPPIHNIK